MNEAAFAIDLMGVRPKLVIFARRLCRDEDRSEDLASATIARAWRYRHKFECGTNLAAWLNFILRNLFLSEQRRQKWNGGNVEDYDNLVLPVAASQENSIHLRDVDAALALLPDDMREALVAVALHGTYEEAADALNVTVGTIKSRACRGRKMLKNLSA